MRRTHDETNVQPKSQITVFTSTCHLTWQPWNRLDLRHRQTKNPLILKRVSAGEYVFIQLLSYLSSTIWAWSLMLYRYIWIGRWLLDNPPCKLFHSEFWFSQDAWTRNLWYRVCTVPISPIDSMSVLNGSYCYSRCRSDRCRISGYSHTVFQCSRTNTKSPPIQINIRDHRLFHNVSSRTAR